MPIPPQKRPFVSFWRSQTRKASNFTVVMRMELDILMIQTDRSGNQGIGRSQHPSDKRYQMHQVKNQSVADGKSTTLANKMNAFGW